MKTYDYLIVGAGFAGAVMAESLASARDKKILIIDKRNHIGGNAYDYYDDHGVLIHKYGPHIFHTNSKQVFDYLSRFTEWFPYQHKVLANHKNKLLPIPINRLTLNKLYSIDLSESEAADFINNVKINRPNAANSKDIILSRVGPHLYHLFFKDYTLKQWGLYPEDLSPEVCGRIPVRFNDDCRYFSDEYQFMPKHGYHTLFQNLLNHKNIEILLNQDYQHLAQDIKYDKMIFTGPIDLYYNYKYGPLPYRSLIFQFENHPQEYYQEVAVVNYVDLEVPFTRVTEYKHLTGQIINGTTISKEYSTPSGEPFYPIPNEASKSLFAKYNKLAENENKVYFCGRLGTYRYYNMDQVVAMSLSLVDKV